MLQPSSNGPTGFQQTVGVRYTASAQWVLALNWRHNNGASMYRGAWTRGSAGGGDLCLQVYHKLTL
jgi:hypothetical protein